MKKTNSILTAGIFISLVFAIVIPILCASVFWAGVDMGSATAFTLCGIPFFFLQWRLCRVEKAKWVKWLPLGFLCAFALLCVMLIVNFHKGLENLVAWIGLTFCMAPTAGIFLGWLAHGEKPAIIGVATSFGAYMIASKVPLVQRGPMLLDAAALFVLGAGIYLMRKKSPKEQES